MCPRKFLLCGDFPQRSQIGGVPSRLRARMIITLHHFHVGMPDLIPEIIGVRTVGQRVRDERVPEIIRLDMDADLFGPFLDYVKPRSRADLISGAVAEKRGVG